MRQGRLEKMIISYLEQQEGPYCGSIRDLAEQLGKKYQAVYRAINTLVQKKQIRHDSKPGCNGGTSLCLLNQEPPRIIYVDPGFLDIRVTASFDSKSLAEQIRQYCNRLPTELRQVVEMRYYENQSIEQISMGLGIPKKTVEARIIDAYDELRSYIYDGQE